MPLSIFPALTKNGRALRLNTTAAGSMRRLTSEASGRPSQHARIRRCVVEKDTDMRNRLVHTLLRCRRAYHADATATSAMYPCARTPRPALCTPCKNPISMGDGTEPLFGEPQVDHQYAQSPGVVQLCASLHLEVSGQCGAHQPHREVQQQARRDASVKRQGARALGDTHFFPEQRVQGGGGRHATVGHPKRGCRAIGGSSANPSLWAPESV
jgi:hypothetical protein